jgi:carbamoyl-phosphate synthase/aspartate carbamoyltransferase
MTYSGNEDDVSEGVHGPIVSEREGDDTRPTTPSTKAFKNRVRSASIAQSKSESLAEKQERGVMVLGCGAYCIGSSVEFDWCAVSAVRQLRKDGFKSIIVNYNPETVSTDYDESDRLYFEELSLERVLDIYEREGAGGIVVSVGGQIPNNLAGPLASYGAKILGTSARDIERAEDRHQFSDMLDEMGLKQPAWSVLSSMDEAAKFSQDVGYPVLVRPSFVLSGAAMRVASDETQLKNFLGLAADVAADRPVVVTKFILGAKEIEFDAVANQGRILNYAIGEHLENAGVHSGDATVILPAQKLYVETIRKIKKYAVAISNALNITGPFNIQFMAIGNDVQVIECNLRASRTFPFVSKTFHKNFISLATKAMCGLKAVPYNINLLDIDYVCVKVRLHVSLVALGAMIISLTNSFKLRRLCFPSLVFVELIQLLASRWHPREKLRALVAMLKEPFFRPCLPLDSNFLDLDLLFSYQLRMMNSAASLLSLLSYSTKWATNCLLLPEPHDGTKLTAT